MLSASLWPCLQTPLTDKRKKEYHKSTQELKLSFIDNIKYLQIQKSVKGCVISEERVDLGKKEDVSEGVDDDTQNTESDRDSLVVFYIDGVAEVWMSTRKKGRRSRIMEPQLATRKSSRIQDQGIPMEKKASMLKSIHNLETQAKTKNSFNVLNNASTDYLDKVATSCGIILGSQSQTASEIISAMQAQELVRAVLARAEKEKLEKGDN